jgi:hypothetical protein
MPFWVVVEAWSFGSPSASNAPGPAPCCCRRSRAPRGPRR